jgi:hypothetical protein
MSALSKSVASIVVVLVVATAACSAGPGTEPEGQSSQDLLCSVHGPCPTPPGPTLAQCATALPTCYWNPELGQSSWASATPDDITDPPAAAAWIAELESAGCETPGFMDWSYFHLSDGTVFPSGGLAVTRCPVSVLDLAPPPTSSAAGYGLDGWSSLEILCNACISPAPKGWVNLGWDVPEDRPGGCKAGSCSSLQ